MRPALILAILVLFAPPALAQSAFPDNPEHHWIWEALLNLKKEGLLVLQPESFRNSHTLLSRSDLAKSLQATVGNVRKLWEEWLPRSIAISKVDSQHGLEAVRSTVDLAQKSARLSPSLIRLIEYFKEDMTPLGFSFTKEVAWLKGLGRLSSSLPLGYIRSFPDVLSSHWASGAIEELRSMGLLVGYPDGKFKG